MRRCSGYHAIQDCFRGGLSNMSKGLSAIEDDIADSDIRRFVDAINAAYAEHAAPAGASMAVRRERAARVRQSGCEGGRMWAGTRVLDRDGVCTSLTRPGADAELPTTGPNQVVCE